ncbi:MAG TPA: hypothetical protein V6C98_02380, partial [Thermosynechococcaceae cyanobacterium]
ALQPTEIHLHLGETVPLSSERNRTVPSVSLNGSQACAQPQTHQFDEQELLDNLQPAYDVWEQETIEKGQQEEREESRRREAELTTRTVPMLLRAGLSINQIAQQLQVEVEAVRQAAQQSQS